MRKIEKLLNVFRKLPIAHCPLPIAYCLFVIVLLTGCSVSKNSYPATKKYSLSELDKDYTLYRDILELHHPSLYWYTPKDSMDYYFDWGKQHLKDSMTEPEFRKILNYVTAKVNCGHTTVRSSKKWSRYSDTVRAGRIFPLSVKMWEDATVVTINLNRRDSILKRGTVITKINGRTIDQLVDTMFNFISTDGYNRTHKFQSLSNRGYFGGLYTTLYGQSNRYTVEYISPTGELKTTSIPIFNPAADTVGRGTRPLQRAPQPSRRERRRQELANARLLQVDTVNKTAMMNLTTFGRGVGLRKFFRQSFRGLNDNKVKHLIIDVRSNGGGSVTNSTLLTKYISDHKFKICDTLYSVRKGSKYDRYIKDQFWNKLFMTLFTKKRKDGYYHFGYFERHAFKPRRKNHYDGKVYILTGGNSFSATTLFVSSVVKQENVIVVGEETGGGAYGNSAWLLPDMTLPETGVRVKLPLFRLVIDKTVPKIGRGVQPEVESFPTVDAIRRNADFKMETTLQLIKEDKERGRSN